MTYSAGNTILHDDYNTFATGAADGSANNSVANINTIWGAGTGDKGYGQSSTVTSVSAAATITATQWATLFTRFTSIANHQGTSVTAITNPVATDLIVAKTTFASDLSTLFTNRSNAYASGTDITTNGTTTTTSNWATSATFTQTFTFADAASARYFFNAGGMLRMSYSRSGGTSSTKNTDWSNLLTAVGTIVITGAAGSKVIAGTSYTGTTKVGGSGSTTTLATSTGFYALTTTPVEIFKQYSGTSPYTSNYIKIQASINAGATAVTITVTLQDDATDTVSPDGNASITNLDRVDGTLTATHVIRPPETTYITSTWGSPTMNSVSWTVSG